MVHKAVRESVLDALAMQGAELEQAHASRLRSVDNDFRDYLIDVLEMKEPSQRSVTEGITPPLRFACRIMSERGQLRRYGADFHVGQYPADFSDLADELPSSVGKGQAQRPGTAIVPRRTRQHLLEAAEVGHLKGFMGVRPQRLGQGEQRLALYRQNASRLQAAAGMDILDLRDEFAPKKGRPFESAEAEDLSELWRSFVKTCQEAHRTYADGMTFMQQEARAEFVLDLLEPSGGCRGLNQGQTLKNIETLAEAAEKLETGFMAEFPDATWEQTARAAFELTTELALAKSAPQQEVSRSISDR